MLRMPAHPTATTVRSGLVAECLSVPAPGTAGEAGATAAGEAGAMGTAPTDAAARDAEAILTAALPAVAEVPVAGPTVADTGKNSKQREVATAGSTALPAFFSLVDGPPPTVSRLTPTFTSALDHEAVDPLRT